MCKVKPPIAERHDVVVWEEMEIINKFNYFLSYPIYFTLKKRKEKIKKHYQIFKKVMFFIKIVFKSAYRYILMKHQKRLF